jgi:multiple sugar transport system permease protein
MSRRIGLDKVLLTPVLAFLLIFYIGPMAFDLWASVRSDGGALSARGTFVGLAHYRSVLVDPRIWSSASVTIVFTVAVVLTTYGVGLAAALTLNRKFFGRDVIGSLLLIPWTMPLVVVAVVWGWLLDYQFGVVNYTLEQLGLVAQPVGFLTDTDLALTSVGAAQVWRLFPLAMVILLAALKAIPQELYEAAAIDGANRLQSFWYVTLPSIRSTTVALVVLIAIWAFGRVFTIVFVMTGGGPAGATETLVIATYLEAFRFFRLERASALGALVLAVSIVLTSLYLRTSRDHSRQG